MRLRRRQKRAGYKKLVLTLYVCGHEQERQEILLDGSDVFVDMPYDRDRVWVWKAELLT